jgi:hypothetical protein
MQIAGGAARHGKTADGSSLVPLLKGDDSISRDAIYVESCQSMRNRPGYPAASYCLRKKICDEF